MKAKQAAQKLQAMGQDGDTILAHINPGEAAHLKAMGGSGKVNPKTGLLSFGGYEGEGTDFSGPGFEGGDWGGFDGYGGKPGESAMAQAAAMAQDMTPEQYAGLQQAMIDSMGGQYSSAINSALGGLLGPVAGAASKFGGIGDQLSKMIAEQQVMNTPYGGAPPSVAVGAYEGANLANDFASSAPAAQATAASVDGLQQAMLASEQQQPFQRKFGLLRDQLSTPFTRTTGSGLLSTGGGFFGS